MTYACAARWVFLAATGVALMTSQAACSLAASGLDAGPPKVCGPTTTMAFQDDFDDDTIGTQWKVSSLGGITVTETTREVQIVSQGMSGRWASYNWDLGTQGTRSLRGCHVFIEVAQVLSQSDPATVFLSLKGLDQGDELTIKQTGGFLYLIGNVGAAPPQQKKVPYDPTTHRWWRIEESDGTVSFRTSPDGRIWMEQASIQTPPFVDAVTLSFGAGSDSAFLGGTAIFDNLNTAP